MPPTSPRLSLAVIARDNEETIERCLRSVEGLADEIILVDTGSTDDTVAIAEKCGAHVAHFEWINDFSAARNNAVDRAKGDWILVLDTDEYLPEKSGQLLQKLIKETPLHSRAFQLLNKSTRDGGASGTVGSIVRLFPNDPRIRYEWPVHEQVVESLTRAGIPIVDTDIEIHHTGYSSPEVCTLKQRRNLGILQKMTSGAQATHPMAWFLKGGSHVDLNELNEALEAYEQCMQYSRPGETAHEAGRVRRATCLLEIERHRDVLEILPSSNPSTWHPELLVAAGTAFTHEGNSRGLDLFVLALESISRPRIPAYDSVKVKAKALMGIASISQTKNSAQSVALLRLALHCLQTGQEPSLTEIPSMGGPLPGTSI